MYASAQNLLFIRIRRLFLYCNFFDSTAIRRAVGFEWAEIERVPKLVEEIKSSDT